MIKNSSIKHIHEDPLLIEQANCKSILSVGQFVYQNSNGIYNPALATSNQAIGWVQGVVWSFIDENSFYLKTTPGPFEYRHPLTKDFFINGIVNEEKIPGSYGDILWLSETSPGNMQNTVPAPGNMRMLLGYKTIYGFLYQPKYITCCIDDASTPVEEL